MNVPESKKRTGSCSGEAGFEGLDLGSAELPEFSKECSRAPWLRSGGIKRVAAMKVFIEP